MVIIQDSQEKTPWNFTFHGYEQKRKLLKTGDYTLEGYEDILCIERKNSTGELANNFGLKWKPFQREMERMLKFPERYLICEFPESHLFVFPLYSNIPKSTWPKLRIGANFMCDRINLLKERYNMNIIFANDQSGAEYEAIEIFKNVINKYGKTT